MNRQVQIGGRAVGDGQPTFIIAEIGINHNGSLETALRLIDAASAAGCDAVKFQKRTPELCVPADQRDLVRETPWGRMSYLEYRHRVEFGVDEYGVIDSHCRSKEIQWFASCWDLPSVEFMQQFDPPCFKVASATVTDHELLRRLKRAGCPVILSTGMSTLEQIDEAVSLFDTGNIVITHCTSTYPCQPDELNLRTIETLQRRYNCLVGYSGHEVGLPTTVAAVAMGACLVERHITLDRAMWGSDQAASIEPNGFVRLVQYIRVIENAMGDGVKRVYPSELPILARLRRSSATAVAQ